MMKKNMQIVQVVVVCSKCGSKEIRKYRKTNTGEQKYLCDNEKCPNKIFKMEYRTLGELFDVESNTITYHLQEIYKSRDYAENQAKGQKA